MKKLLEVQSKLEAPKGQTNKFGGYKYRSAEDILKVLKPLLKEHELVMIINDEIVEVAGRVYVKATVTLNDGETTISTTAYAREPINKKGMDESQVTGAASSYARKYALNGMFAIDDTKDADSMDNSKEESDSEKVKRQTIVAITKAKGDKLMELAEKIDGSTTLQENHKQELLDMISEKADA
jgi:hypothetical protein